MTHKKDVARALAGDQNLRGANLSMTYLEDIDLRGVDLDEANLQSSDLRGANLWSANLRGADLRNARLDGATIKDANLEDARLTHATLRGADLSGSNLQTVSAYGAVFIDANLTKADLRVANLDTADLAGANLRGANLSGADIGVADLRRANLVGARLATTNLRSSDLEGADLSNANMDGAFLVDTHLGGARLDNATLRGARLTRARLRGASLRAAQLRGANLQGAVLVEADLRGADLTDANLGGAFLAGANLTEANLRGTDLTDADLTGVIGYAPPVPVRRRTSGRATGAALKLAAPDAPVDPREFKKRFPREFDLLARRGLAGRPFRPDAIAAIQQQLASPVEWVITKSKYPGSAQRYCAAPNDVLLLNIELTSSSLTERQRAALRRLAEVSRRSGHPHEKGDLFTIGWVRYCAGDGVWLIEEVQSDVQVARTGLKDPETRTKLASAGIDAESFEEAIAALAPYTEAFYHDAIGLVFEMAKAEGVEVEMLEYEAKREFGSPRGIYTDLPREMGMTMREGSRVLPDESDGIEQVWAYRPNPARRRRR